MCIHGMAEYEREAHKDELERDGDGLSSLNAKMRSVRYYLGDGIYRDWVWAVRRTAMI